MKLTNKILSVLSKVLEIVHWTFSGLAIVVMIACICNEQLIANAILTGEVDLAYYGFDATTIYDFWGDVDMFGVYVCIIGGIVSSVFMALIFHNISAILKIISKKDETSTPFQNNILKKVRLIGIYLISLPILDLILDIIMYFVSEVHPRVTIDIMSFMIGLTCLSLTQIFTYGIKLEKEVDGLL